MWGSHLAREEEEAPERGRLGPLALQSWSKHVAWVNPSMAPAVIPSWESAVTPEPQSPLQ